MFIIAYFKNNKLYENSLNLRKSASIKSKRIAKIPRGTIMVINQDSGYKESTFTNDWVRVTYVEKGKKYIGYVNREFIIM
ncbi:MAG: SH3 domain-containing protein [Kurthia sp.]|nr:SH3 domain-containing protein [Candidatus Kurthia equi]